MQSSTIPPKFPALPKNSWVIGLVGHRFLRPEDATGLREALRETFKWLDARSKRPIILLTARQPGAETIAASVAEEAAPGRKPVKVIPFTPGSQSEIAAQQLVRHSHSLLALWDGVHESESGDPKTNKKENARDLVSSAAAFALEPPRAGRRAHNLRDSNPRVFHLLTPHTRNPFPTFRPFSLRVLIPQKKVKQKALGHLPLWKRWGFYFVGVPAVIALATTILGTIGLLRYHRAPSGQSIPIQDAIIGAAGLNALQEPAGIDRKRSGHVETFPWELELARILGLLFVPSATVLGVIAAVCHNMRHWQVWRHVGTTGMKPRCRYAIVCGLGWRGWDILRDLRYQQFKVAAIEKDEKGPFVEASRCLGAWVFEGDATDKVLLQRLLPEKAEKIFTVTGDEDINVRTAATVAELVERRRKGQGKREVRCNVDLASPERLAILEASAETKSKIEIRLFNTAESTSRMLIDRYPIDRFRTLRGDCVHSSEPRSLAHVIIIGDPLDTMERGDLLHTRIPTPSALANSLLQLTCRSAEFCPGAKVEVTVMTPDPGKAARRFRDRHPVYGFREQAGFVVEPSKAPFRLEPLATWERIDVYDRDAINSGSISPDEAVLPPVEFLPIPDSDGLLLSNDSPLFRARSAGTVITVYVCLDDGPVNANLLRRFGPKLAAVREKTSLDAQVFYYFNSPEREIPTDFDRRIHQIAPNLPMVSFGPYLFECSVETVESTQLDVLAKLVNHCYAVTPNFDRQNLDDFVPRKLPAKKARAKWKDADEKWANISEDDRNSSRMCADHIDVKLRGIGEDIYDELGGWGHNGLCPHNALFERLKANDESLLIALSIMEHRRWCADRLMSGWRWAEEINKPAREQNCLLPWDQLPEDVRAKDHLLIYSIPQILSDQRQWLEAQQPS